VKHDKLAKQFNDTLIEYENLVKLSLRKEREIASFIEERRSVREQDPDERERRISRFSDLQELKLSEVDEQAILEEQNKDMLQIEKDLVELADCFIDMANEVKIQGEELNKVENNTSKSAGTRNWRSF